MSCERAEEGAEPYGSAPVPHVHRPTGEFRQCARCPGRFAVTCHAARQVFCDSCSGGHRRNYDRQAKRDRRWKARQRAFERQELVASLALEILEEGDITSDIRYQHGSAPYSAKEYAALVAEAVHQAFTIAAEEERLGDDELDALGDGWIPDEETSAKLAGLKPQIEELRVRLECAREMAGMLNDRASARVADEKLRRLSRAMRGIGL